MPITSFYRRILKGDTHANLAAEVFKSPEKSADQKRTFLLQRDNGELKNVNMYFTMYQM